MVSSPFLLLWKLISPRKKTIKRQICILYLIFSPNLFFSVLLFYFVYWCFTCIFVYVSHSYLVPECQWRWEEIMDALVLDSETLVSQRISAMNQTWVPWKNSQCSKQTSSLFIPPLPNDCWIKYETRDRFTSNEKSIFMHKLIWLYCVYKSMCLLIL